MTAAAAWTVARLSMEILHDEQATRRHCIRYQGRACPGPLSIAGNDGVVVAYLSFDLRKI